MADKRVSVVVKLFGVSRSLGVEGPSSSLHLREEELTTGLALEDLVEVVRAELDLTVEDVAVCLWLSIISTVTDLLKFLSRLTLGKISPEVEL